MTAERDPIKYDMRVYFDETLVGRRVQADGGAASASTTGTGQQVILASRESFEGRLTGRRLEHGNPPWRWLEVGDLTDKPSDFEDSTVWCEESYVFFLDD